MVSVSIVLSVLLVALILCCFCRINSAAGAGAGSRRRRGARGGHAGAHHTHTLAGTNSTHSNRLICIISNLQTLSSFEIGNHPWFVGWKLDDDV